MWGIYYDQNNPENINLPDQKMTQWLKWRASSKLSKLALIQVASPTNKIAGLSMFIG